MLTNYQAQVQNAFPFMNLSVGRNEPLNKGIRYAGDDFTGATFLAQVRSEPEALGAPLLTLTVSIISVMDMTIQQLIDDCTITASEIPCGMTVETILKVSDLNLSASKASIQALPANADPRKNSILVWDLLLLTPQEFVLEAGNFTVIPGVSR